MIVLTLVLPMVLGACGSTETGGINPNPGSAWSLQGEVSSQSDKAWVVSQHTIMIEPGTVISGQPKVGSQVSIVGRTLSGGEFVAMVIEKLADVILVPTVTPVEKTTQTTNSTPGYGLTRTPTVSVTPGVSPTPATSPTAGATPTVAVSPTSTLPPANIIIEIEGPITYINVINNLTVVVINNVEYVLAPETVQFYGPRLAIGMFLKFKTKRIENGQFILITIIAINGAVVTQPVVVVQPPVVVVQPPVKGGDDDDEKDGKHKSKGPEGGKGKK